MVRQLASAPGGWNRSVVFYVRIPAEEVSRPMTCQPRPPVEEIARELNLTRERVRQIQNEGLAKLRRMATHLAE